MSSYTADEMMVVAAARELRSEDICFVGVGTPSEACNLARLTHAPAIELIYESGTIGTRPNVLPLSVADGDLCDTALATVPVVEMFRYWIQGGRIPHCHARGSPDRPLRKHQLDRHWRLQEAEGSASRGRWCTGTRDILRSGYVTMKQSRRGFVQTLDFLTTCGHGHGGSDRRNRGMVTQGPTRLITDCAIWKPDPETREFTVVSLHPGITRERMAETVGWEIRYADPMAVTADPTAEELGVLRDLHARTEAAHAGEASAREE